MRIGKNKYITLNPIGENPIFKGSHHEKWTKNLKNILSQDFDVEWWRIDLEIVKDTPYENPMRIGEDIAITVVPIGENPIFK